MALSRVVEASLKLSTDIQIVSDCKKISYPIEITWSVLIPNWGGREGIGGRGIKVTRFFLSLSHLENSTTEPKEEFLLKYTPF